jgi:hypothetical protein
MAINASTNTQMNSGCQPLSSYRLRRKAGVAFRRGVEIDLEGFQIQFFTRQPTLAE